MLALAFCFSRQLKNLYWKSLYLKKPVTEKPVSEKPVSEKPVSETPESEKPVSEKPVLCWHLPFASNTSTQKPEKPVTEKPVSEVSTRCIYSKGLQQLSKDQINNNR